MLILLGTIPAVVLGLLFKPFFEAAFGDPVSTAVQLILNGGLLFLAEWLARRQRARALSTLNTPDAIVMGLAQAAAILPGISRSGLK